MYQSAAETVIIDAITIAPGAMVKIAMQLL
jgi:hypothetical protein